MSEPQQVRGNGLRLESQMQRQQCRGSLAIKTLHTIVEHPLLGR